MKTLIKTLVIALAFSATYQPVYAGAKEIVDKILSAGNMKPDLACKTIGTFGRGLAILDQDQKAQVCTMCDDYFVPQGNPKAREATCGAIGL